MEDNKSIIVQSEIQMLPMERLQQNYNNLVKFSKDILKDGQDYGVIPGVDKPSLLKPGAEKLRLAYGLQTKTELVKEILDFDRPYLDFTYRTTVLDGQGRTLAECEGNTNSYEPKWRYVWVAEHDVPAHLHKIELKSKQVTVSEFKFALSKKETSGSYGKPAEYWAKFEKAIADGKAKEIQRDTKNGKKPAWEISTTYYRIPNPDVIGLKNTLMKMAQKRSFVGAIMIATGASEFYTQDVEDMKEVIIEEAEYTVQSKPVENPPQKKTETVEDLGVDVGDGTDKPPTDKSTGLSAVAFRQTEIIAGLGDIKECKAFVTELKKNKDITENEMFLLIDRVNKRIKEIQDASKNAE